MFLNPLMLAALGATVLPLVLHLLARASYQRIDFSAMMFLVPQLGQRRHAARLKQILLLLTRMAILATLAVALARPVLRGAAPLVGESSHISSVIIIDRSASMAFEENGRSNLDQAKLAVMNILANLRRGDTAALVFMGDPSSDSVVQSTNDLQSLAVRIDDLKPSFGRADVAAALMQAARIFQTDKNLNRELYLVCDRQAISWNGVDDAFNAAWMSAVVREGAAPRCFLLPIGGDQNENVAIESMQMLGPPIVRGQQGELEVRIRNFGAQPRAGIPLAITTGPGRELYRGTVNIAANSSASIIAPVQFATSGSHVVTARLSTSGFKSDDQFELAVDLLDPVKVLVIRAAEDRAAGDVLALALAPYDSAGEAGADPAVVAAASDNQDLPAQRPDVIILDDLPILSAQLVGGLEQFVYTGGGLLIAPGALAQLENYDRMLFKDYTGLLPARLKPPTPADGSRAMRLAQLDRSSPIFQFTGGRPDALPDVSIDRYFPTVDRIGAHVLGTYSSGEPFLLERAYGRGHVILATTSLRGDWNSLPRTSFFLPMMQSMVRWLARSEEPGRNLSIGQPIEAVITDAVRGRTAQIILPDGAAQQIELASSGQSNQVRFSGTHQPGRYTLRVPLQNGDERLIYFIVQLSIDEADPTPLSAARWQWIERALQAQRTDSADKAQLTKAIGQRRSGRELYLPLIALAGALIVLEIGLTRIWTAEL